MLLQCLFQIEILSDHFPVIRLDETVYDYVVYTDSVDEPFPDPKHIMCEDDLVGKHTSIVFNDNLKELASFQFKTVISKTIPIILNVTQHHPSR